MLDGYLNGDMISFGDLSCDKTAFSIAYEVYVRMLIRIVVGG